jgi:subtilisin-like proprotein convertase family protein
VFGSANVQAKNLVTVTGGEWLGTTQTYNFTQTISPNSVSLNTDDTPAGEEMVTKALLVISDELGRITISVDNENGLTSAIAGLAISPTKLGSITGQKWNDVNGNGSAPEDGEEGLEGWRIYLDMNNNGVLDVISTPALPVTQSSPDVPQAITDGATVKSELNFTQAGEIADINVTVDIAHTAVGDLNIWLTSPSGTKVKLFDDIGAGANNILVTIDDEATEHLPIFPAVQPITGTYKPDLDSDPDPNVQLLLSAFDGEDAAGIWKLEVFDDQANDIGQINGWSINVTIAESITYLEPFQITDPNGNYTFTDVKPGQYFVREHIEDEQEAEGWRQSWAAPPVTVTTGANVTGVDFGNWIPVFIPGSISGQKWHDVNGDGNQDGGDVGLADWQIYLDLNNNGMLDVDTVPQIVSATDVPKSIIDFGTTTSVLEVGDLGTIRSIEVTLDITHSFVGDLDAFLTSPSGRIVELFTGVGSQYNNFTNLTLSDDAAESIADIGADDVPYTGTWRPEGLLGEFLGDSTAGNWTLTVRDTSFADQGTLNSWSLAITVGEPVTVTDENGNYSFEDLPPGPYVVREVQQPGWAQTSAPAILTDPMGNPYNVIVAGGGNVVANFGNKIAVALPGDFNRDGFVDMGDWIIHRKMINTAVANPYDGADGDGDGFVTEADLLVWRQNFGSVLDDHGDDAATATSVAVGGSVPGNIEQTIDQDWFSFAAQSGVEYEIATFHNGGIDDSVLWVYDTDGTTELAYDDDSGNGLEALINWIAPASGIYFVAVGSYNTAYTGTYDLSITEAMGGSGGETLAAEPGDDSVGVAMAVATLDDAAANSADTGADDTADAVVAFANGSWSDFVPAATAKAGSATAAIRLREESDKHSGEAAIVAWLDSLDDSHGELDSDEFVVSNPSSDESAGDELEGIDALFDLIGA